MYNILEQPINMYDQYDYNVTLDSLLMNNRLFCTFSPLNDLDLLISGLSSRYTIMYNKMFVLHIKSNNEYVVTYNVDQGNINDIPENTILVHRKKDSNTLYTINALNQLIKSLNGGVLDNTFAKVLDLILSSLCFFAVPSPFDCNKSPLATVSSLCILTTNEPTDAT